MNTIHKRVVFENLYTKEILLCSPCSSSNMSSIARSICRRTCRALFAQFVVEHVEHCSPNSLSNMSNIVRPTRCRACRALLACQVVELVNSRTSCYMLRCRIYITLFRARFVTLFLFFKVFVSKVIAFFIMSF